MRLTGDEVLDQIQIYLNTMITAAHVAKIFTSSEQEKAYIQSRLETAADLLDLIKDLREGKTTDDHVRANIEFLSEVPDDQIHC